MTNEYLKIIIFIATVAVFGAALLFLPFFINKLKPDNEKLSQYECGVEPIGKARTRFDIHFYLIAMIFIIFDLEIAFILPWAVNAKKLGVFAFFSMLSFLTIVTASLIYEYKKDVINW